MATTPPVPDNNKLAALIALADKIPERVRALVDAIKNPNGEAMNLYGELRTLALTLKDQTNGAYAMAGNADRSLQTGKRKEKAEKPAKDDKLLPGEKVDFKGKKQTRAERREKHIASRTSAEPAMSEGSSDDP